MSETENKPLLTTGNGDLLLHPPPPYKPIDSEESDVERPTPVKYSQSLPLPTYEQSEKYETEGVLEYDPNDVPRQETGEVTLQQVRVVGTWCEFFIFFFICSTLSIFGFIIAMCVAMTVAAHGGALAGLGIALVSKPILFEMYDESAMRAHVELKYCSGYDAPDNCVDHVYTIARFCFWMIGIIGLLLFYKGTATFLQAKRSVANSPR